MLVQCVQSTLTLGVNVYKKGDVFDCKEPEASALAHVGILKKMPAGTKTTRESPRAPSIGVSNGGNPGVGRVIPGRAPTASSTQAAVPPVSTLVPPASSGPVMGVISQGRVETSKPVNPVNEADKGTEDKKEDVGKGKKTGGKVWKDGE